MITILGIGHITKEDERASYQLDATLSTLPSLKKANYTNTLPLLIDNFETYEIIPIFTQKAKESQVEVLKSEFGKCEDIFAKGYLIEDENRYDDVFKMLNDTLSDKRYDELIIDLTHGFRHLPLLVLITLIIQNIKNPDKIKHILFAKEIDPREKYLFIDLKAYLDLAKLSFVLANFNENYTIGNKLSFDNPTQQELVDNLRLISSHILANSIQTLIETDNSLVTQTVRQFNTLMQNDEKINTFSIQIEEIITHLNELEALKSKEHYIKLFYLAQIMAKREYLLNAITLLNESIGLYCAKTIATLSPQMQEHINRYLEQEKSNLYELAHQSKNIIKNRENFTGDYLFEPDKIKPTAGEKTRLQKKKKKLKEQISPEIINKIEKAGFKLELSTIDTRKEGTIKNRIVSSLDKQDHTELSEIIVQAEKLRNNLAHGNSSEKIENVKYEVTTLLKKFEAFIQLKEDDNKKKKQKSTPKGIDVPKEIISTLEALFKNR